MSDAWIDVPKLKSRLEEFFDENRGDLSKFGSTVNQTFEAFVFAQVAAWFKAKPGWQVEVVNPQDEAGRESLRLKFSTRGRPANYSYFRCVSPDGSVLQIRHQLRVATRHHRASRTPPANVCLDVAVIGDVDLSVFSTHDQVANEQLLTFGEAKHMSAFAELVASFIGLVHEMQPQRLKRIRVKNWRHESQVAPPPFLFVSGHLWRTAEGVVQTITRRRFDIDVYTNTKLLAAPLTLPS